MFWVKKTREKELNAWDTATLIWDLRGQEKPGCIGGRQEDLPITVHVEHLEELASLVGQVAEDYLGHILSTEPAELCGR